MSWTGYRERTVAGGRTIGYRTMDGGTIARCPCGASYIQTIRGEPWGDPIPASDIVVIGRGDVGEAAKVLADMGARQPLVVDAILRALVGG